MEWTFFQPISHVPSKKRKKKEEGKITSHVSGVAALIRYNVIGSISKNKILNSNCYYLRLKHPLFILNSEPWFLWYSRLFGGLDLKPITLPYESCYLTQATCRFLFNVFTVLYFGWQLKVQAKVLNTIHPQVFSSFVSVLINVTDVNDNPLRFLQPRYQ